MSSMGSEQRILERFMQLSIAAAVATIILKALAAWFTGSVGFLSDAFESIAVSYTHLTLPTILLV